MDLNPALTESELGLGFHRAVGALLDYQEELDYESQHYDRAELEKETWDGFFGYVRTGLSLKSIAYYHRYKKECKTFKQYCEKFLNISVGYAKKIMEAADVWIQLAGADFEILPNCVSQAIPLIKYNVVDQYGDSPLGDKWQEVLDRAADTRKRITSTLVKEVVDQKEAPRRMEVDNDLWEIINHAAAKTGVSKKEFVRKAIENYLSPEENPDISEVDAEAQRIWEQDLQNLIEEHDSENSAPAEDDILEEPTPTPPLLPVSPPPHIEEQSKLAISFGKTLEPLLQGIKTVTRRVWKDIEVKKFSQVFERGLWVKALSKAYFCGGKQIGWVRLKKAPYQEPLNKISQSDCDAEGYPELSPGEFLDRFFKKESSDRTVWVLEFEFLRC